MPFGEFVPLESILRPLARSLICRCRHSAADHIFSHRCVEWHSTYCGHLLRNHSRRARRDNFRPDTDYLLTISNDAWLVSLLVHGSTSRWRECVRWSGAPTVAQHQQRHYGGDWPAGEIQAMIPQFTREVLTTNVTRPPDSPRTHVPATGHCGC